MYHFIEEGAEDELSLRRNMSAFDDYSLTPKYLTDVSKVNTKTTVLGHVTSMHLFLSPTGTSRLFHHEKAIAVAKAGAKFGVPYALSAMMTKSIKDFSEHSEDQNFFKYKSCVTGF